jgi:DNA-binding MarR family transcriptional regulator
VERGESERLHELFMELVRVAGLLQPDHELPGTSVSMSQAFALHELDKGAPLSQQELAERLLLEKSTVSRMVADLQDKALITRQRDSANLRTYRLLLTDKGRDCHARMAAGYRAQYHRWTEAMTPVEREALLLGLPALIRAVRGHPGESR